MKSIHQEAILKLKEIAEKLTRKQWLELTSNIESIRNQLQQAQKQEKLLELYRQLVLDLGLVIEHDWSDDWDGTHDYECLEINEKTPDALNTYKKIKELEK